MKRVLDFYAPWCAPCKAIEPHLMKVADSVGIKVEKLNVELKRETFNEFNVRTVPTLILMEGENETARLTGKVDLDTIKRFLSADN
jgi:thioredoxin 1